MSVCTSPLFSKLMWWDNTTPLFDCFEKPDVLAKTFRRLKQFIIPVQYENDMHVWASLFHFSFQETFVENKHDGVSRKYIPPARWALQSCRILTIYICWLSLCCHMRCGWANAAYPTKLTELLNLSPQDDVHRERQQLHTDWRSIWRWHHGKP